MRTRFFAAGVACLAALALAASAGALVNGTVDVGHPYVVELVNPSAHEICSGSLINANTVVTAAHCLGGDHQVAVFTGVAGFPNVPPQAAASFGIGVPSPDWRTGTTGLSTSDSNDFGVVHLFVPIALSTYASLPSAGYDGSLPNNQAVDLVGYGVTDPSGAGVGVKHSGPARIIPGGGATGDMFLKISSNPAQGVAMCSGDSGGPILKAGTNVILGIVSYGASATCMSVGYAQRLDTATALGFIH